MNKLHQVQGVRFKEGRMFLAVDGREVVCPLAEISPRLLNASAEARENFRISPSGYGIHWPDCDEDLSIDALLGVRHDAPMIAAEEPGEYKISNNP
ncbi:MAG: DUF2442 domain-containing protein [Pontiellaceae bacterium]|nr:DUF2442 domain-containing protein [Pontiellaceae bacterium]